MFKSIRWRIAIPYILLISIITLGLGLYINDFLHQIYLDQTQKNLQKQAQLIGQDLAHENILFPNDPILSQRVNRWSQLLGAQITIINADGEVIADSEDLSPNSPTLLQRPEIQLAAENGAGKSQRFSNVFGEDVLYLAVPLPDGGREGFVRIGLPESKITSVQHKLRDTIFFVGGITVLVATLLSFFIASRTTKPLIRLTKSAQQMTEGTMDELLVSGGDREIGQLARAFNTLVKTLRDQIIALQSERGKLSAVLQQMTDGVIIVNQEDEIELINPAAERLFNTSAKKAAGHSAAEILRHHQWIDLLDSSREEEKEQAQSVELPGRDKFLQGFAIPLGETMPDHTLLLFQDLTRIKRLETTRQDFISNISHELRTPLASLKALTETLQSGAMEDPSAANKFLSRIEREVDALAQMVSELLELSRIESGQVPLDTRPITIPPVIEDAIDRLRAQAKRRGITIHREIGQALPEISADPRRIEQVLVNLVHNAIKYSHEDGHIYVGAEPEEGRIVFYVKDQGLGIPAADLPRIFERFYKTDQARSGGGTGLGLAISKHIIEAHGGEVWAESELDQGSTFYFSLPMTPED